MAETLYAIWSFLPRSEGRPGPKLDCTLLVGASRAPEFTFTVLCPPCGLRPAVVLEYLGHSLAQRLIEYCKTQSDWTAPNFQSPIAF